MRPRTPTNIALGLVVALVYVCGVLMARQAKTLETGSLEWLCVEQVVIFCIGEGACLALLIIRNMDRDVLDDLEKRVGRLEEEDDEKD